MQQCAGRPRPSWMAGLAIMLCGSNVMADDSTPPETGGMLRPYVAEYETRSRGLTSIATRILHRTGAPADATVRTYRLSQALSVRLLGANLITVDESSHFAQTGPSLVAGAYRYEQTGLGRRSEHIRFDWDNNSARVTTRDGEQRFGLESGVLDPLSFTAQLRLDVRAALEAGSDRTDFRYRIMEDDGIDEHLYRLSGREALDTPMDRLDTVRLERIREPGSSRSTTVWLAPANGYIMARFLQTEEDGPDMELVLASLEWTGD